MLLYRLFLLFYRLGISLAANYNGKAKKWIAGRRNWRSEYSRLLHNAEKRIWVHCASLGEYEQARPLIELLKSTHPKYKIVLTFFSPSGYEAFGENESVDYVLYLPLDGPSAAADFVGIVQPSLVLFVKYEFWYYYLKQLKNSDVPTVLVAAAFRATQPFFRWYGGFYRRMLACFSYIHVQDEFSKQLLDCVGYREQVQVSGDTRFDRVGNIASSTDPLPLVELFAGKNKLLIAGSTWPEDEAVLRHYYKELPIDWKLIIAPHEVDKEHISKIQNQFAGRSILYSELREEIPDITADVLIIDNIGLLSKLYAYGALAYVGGGFLKGGIHNVLEPAVFGLPVVIGPVYEKFVEATRLEAIGVVFPVSNREEAAKVLQQLTSDETMRAKVKEKSLFFMKENLGASQRIIGQLSASSWL